MIFGFRRQCDDKSWIAAQEIKGEFERERWAAGPVRTLDDMSDEEIEALERAYGCRVAGRSR